MQWLAEEHPEHYQPQVIQLFCAYVRDPDGGKEVSFFTPPGSMRLDVAAAIEAINAVRKASSFAEKRGLLNLDLRGARLNGMTLRNGNLSSTTAAHSLVGYFHLNARIGFSFAMLEQGGKSYLAIVIPKAPGLFSRHVRL